MDSPWPPGVSLRLHGTATCKRASPGPSALEAKAKKRNFLSQRGYSRKQSIWGEMAMVPPPVRPPQSLARVAAAAPGLSLGNWAGRKFLWHFGRGCQSY